MKSLEQDEKTAIKMKFATGLHKAFKASGLKSMRKVAGLAGMEPSHLQRIATGKLDVTLTTNVAIATAFGLTYAEFAKYYDDVSPKDIKEYLELLESQKRKGADEKE